MRCLYVWLQRQPCGIFYPQIILELTTKNCGRYAEVCHNSNKGRELDADIIEMRNLSFFYTRTVCLSPEHCPGADCIFRGYTR